MSNFIYLIPTLLVLFGAIALLFMSMYEKISVKSHIFVSSLFLVIALVFALLNANTLYSVQPYDSFLNNVLTFDTFSNFFNILIILIGEHYLQHRSYFKGEFFSILLFALFGMMVLAQANELITAFIALEIASFSVYIMVGYNSDDSKRVEAIFKYLVLGAFIGAFFLLGLVLVFGTVASTNLADIYSYIQASNGSNLELLYVGLTLILFTFLFKIAAFPFQSWVLDIYRGAPMIITAYMASTFKIAIFSFFMRLILDYIAPIIDFWDTILQVVIILTLLFGTWLAITQDIVKRLLAASSIVHRCNFFLYFIFFSYGNNSILNIEAAYSIMFYLITYLVSALVAFGLASHIISY